MINSDGRKSPASFLMIVLIINQTDVFKTWLSSLSDPRAKAKILEQLKKCGKRLKRNDNEQN